MLFLSVIFLLWTKNREFLMDLVENVTYLNREPFLVT